MHKSVCVSHQQVHHDWYWSCYHLTCCVWPLVTVCMCRCDGSLAERLPVSLDLTCKPFICAVSVIPTDDGRYRCTYTPDTPGFYRLEVTCKGVHVCDSPFSVQVTVTALLCMSVAPFVDVQMYVSLYKSSSLKYCLFLAPAFCGASFHCSFCSSRTDQQLVVWFASLWLFYM